MSSSKAAVFFSSGLGNALLLVPLLKALKKDGFVVDGIFTSSCEGLFWDETLLTQKISIHRNTSLWKLLFSFRRYEVVYLDFFAVSRKNLWISRFISKKVIAHRKKGFSEAFSDQNTIQWIDTPINTHMAVLNQKMYNTKTLRLSDFLLDKPLVTIKLPHSTYWTVQLSSGNNQTPYKTWPIQHWISLLHVLSKNHSLSFILLGDQHEVHLTKDQVFPENTYNLIGKTNLSEAAYILSKSSLFLGHDSGLMHLAVSMGKSTCTLWGGSDPYLYGYQAIDSQIHTVIHRPKACGPCNSWINPNISRVPDPLLCPDQACIREISVDEVYSVLLQKHVQ